MSAKMSLRVLYTINGSPQYILARSLSHVAVTLLPQDGLASLPDTSCTSALYASVPLKTCLDTICRSSPDLAQDTTRDFSLYVLDPLESSPSPTSVNINSYDSNTSMINAAREKPSGVAVGLGLMSWALGDSEGVVVTGTLVKLGTGQEAVEVIFALRETPSVNQRAWNVSSTSLRPSPSFVQGNPKPLQWYSSGSSGSINGSSLTGTTSTTDVTRETLASIHMRAKGKHKAARATRQSSTPVTQSDKLLSADTYIGPLKKKGRPKSTVEVNVPGNMFPAASSQADSSKDVIIIDGSDTENAAPTSGADHSSYASKKKRPPQRPPPFTMAPLVRCYTDPQQTIPVDGMDLAVSSVPGHCSSSSLANAAPNTALLAALGTIDSSKIQGSSTSHNDSNTDLVAALRQLLAVYAQPSTVFPAPSGSTPAHQPSALLPSDKENMNPTTQRKSAEKGSNLPSDPLRTSPRTNRLNQVLPLQASPQSVSAPRKRTLSDFMDEKDKGKTRGRVGKHDASRTASVQRAQIPADSMRHYPKVLASSLPRVEQPSNYYRTPLEPWTSPIRRKPENDRNKHASAAEPLDSHTLKPASPVNRLKACASSPIRAHKESRRKYIVPEWARTDTATRPRLSEDAQRALKQAEVRRREDRNTARRRLASTKANISTTNPGITKEARLPKSPASEKHAPQVPIAASSNGPVVAFPLASPPMSSSPVCIPKTPKTPSKHRDSSTPLFTPMRSGSLFDSACFSHSCTVPTSILTSPIGNRKRLKKLLMPLTPSTASTNKDSQKSPTGATGGESSLDNRSEKALDEADCPPSSLPIASSDDDTNLQPSSAAKVEEEVTEIEGVKQHWAGLPPSSPPPPSSPMLIPETRMDDEDLDDLPIATSDSEADVDMKTFCHEFVQPSMLTGTTNGDNPFPLNLTDEDFTTLFLMEYNPPSVFDPNPTSNLFEQFICMNTPSDDILLSSLPNNNIQTTVQNGMDTLDFTEFWETFNPMVNANIEATQTIDRPVDFGNSQLLPSAEQIDPVKLADEVQALFGGCVM